MESRIGPSPFALRSKGFGNHTTPEAGLVEAAKGVYDSIKAELPALVKELVSGIVKELEDKHAKQIEDIQANNDKGLELLLDTHRKELEAVQDSERKSLGKLAAVQDAYDKSITEMKELISAIPIGTKSDGDPSFDIVVKVAKMLEDKFEKRLATVASEIERKTLGIVASFDKRLDEKEVQIKGDLTAAMDVDRKSVELLRAKVMDWKPEIIVKNILPELAPVINVPQQSVVVKPADVKPVFNVPQSAVNFNPQINVPEQTLDLKPVLNVSVAVPKKQTTTKSIVYEGNRPSRIVEETTNESEDKK